MNTPTTATPATFGGSQTSSDFESIINLLSVLGEAERQLTALKSEIEVGYLALVTEKREVYAKLQATVSETEAALEVIARRNPQWFEDKKNLATPFGVVKFHSSKELVVADENVSIQLIEAFRAGDKLLRTVKVLNKEALSELSDAELARFAIVRKAKENFSTDVNLVDLGKAVKAAARNEKNAAKAAKSAKKLVQGGAS